MRTILTACLLLLLPGCTSVDTQVDPRHDLAGLQRYFVVVNANDSRGLGRDLVNALRTHGLTAEAGPRTMLPDDTEAVVTYQDNWTWDFGERLTYLQVMIHDARTKRPVGKTEYRAKIPGRQPPAAIVADLVGSLFADKK